MERIPIVLLGEKDHGKSTLLGRILFETKSFPEDRLKAIRKISKTSKKRFEWAHLLDSFRYEREKEMTLDTTRALVKIGANIYEFIDVPGHKELIKNMLSGASNADFGILLIDAEEGIKKQTLEHLKIGNFLKLKKIIIALNKIDKNKNYKLIQKDLERYKYPVIPISAYHGTNVKKLTNKIKKFFKTEKKIKSRKFVAVIQDNYNGAIIPKLLYGNLPKKYKIPKNLKRGDIFSNTQLNYKNKLNCNCVIIEKPSGKLSIESNFKEIPIEKIKLEKNNSFVKKVDLEFIEKIFIYDKFTLKKSGKIIGLCRIGGI